MTKRGLTPPLPSRTKMYLKPNDVKTYQPLPGAGEDRASNPDLPPWAYVLCAALILLGVAYLWIN